MNKDVSRRLFMGGGVASLVTGCAGSITTPSVAQQSQPAGNPILNSPEVGKLLDEGNKAINTRDCALAEQKIGAISDALGNHSLRKEDIPYSQQERRNRVIALLFDVVTQCPKAVP